MNQKLIVHSEYAIPANLHFQFQKKMEEVYKWPEEELIKLHVEPDKRYFLRKE